MKVLNMVMVIVLLLSPVSAWAATATAQATVSATVASVCSISITRDISSVTRGSAGTILFDKRDDQDRPGRGDPAYMYAPYQSETGKNWHVTQIAANGSTMSLSARVAGTVGTTPLANILQVWCAGFFATGGTGSIPDTPSTNWENANGWNRTLSQAFTGVVPFSYRLNITGIAAGGPYTGTITFTVTST